MSSVRKKLFHKRHIANLYITLNEEKFENFPDFLELMRKICSFVWKYHISYILLFSCPIRWLIANETMKYTNLRVLLRFMYIYNSALCFPVSNNISKADKRIMFSPRSSWVSRFLSWMESFSGFHLVPFFLVRNPFYVIPIAVLLAAASVARLTWFLVVPLVPTSFLLLLWVLPTLAATIPTHFHPRHPFYPFRTLFTDTLPPLDHSPTAHPTATKATIYWTHTERDAWLDWY